MKQAQLCTQTTEPQQRKSLACTELGTDFLHLYEESKRMPMKTQEHSGFARNYVGEQTELLKRVRTNKHHDMEDKHISTNGRQQ
jgi:hypothetical protein